MLHYYEYEDILRMKKEKEEQESNKLPPPGSTAQCSRATVSTADGKAANVESLGSHPMGCVHCQKSEDHRTMPETSNEFVGSEDFNPYMFEMCVRILSREERPGEVGGELKAGITSVGPVGPDGRHRDPRTISSLSGWSRSTSVADAHIPENRSTQDGLNLQSTSSKGSRKNVKLLLRPKTTETWASRPVTIDPSPQGLSIRKVAAIPRSTYKGLEKRQSDSKEVTQDQTPNIRVECTGNQTDRPKSETVTNSESEGVANPRPAAPVPGQEPAGMAAGSTSPVETPGPDLSPNQPRYTMYAMEYHDRTKNYRLKPKEGSTNGTANTTRHPPTMGSSKGSRYHRDRLTAEFRTMKKALDTKESHGVEHEQMEPATNLEVGNQSEAKAAPESDPQSDSKDNPENPRFEMWVKHRKALRAGPSGSDGKHRSIGCGDSSITNSMVDVRCEPGQRPIMRYASDPMMCDKHGPTEYIDTYQFEMQLRRKCGRVDCLSRPKTPGRNPNHYLQESNYLSKQGYKTRPRTQVSGWGSTTLVFRPKLAAGKKADHVKAPLMLRPFRSKVQSESLTEQKLLITKPEKQIEAPLKQDKVQEAKDQVINCVPREEQVTMRVLDDCPTITNHAMKRMLSAARAPPGDESPGGTQNAYQLELHLRRGRSRPRTACPGGNNPPAAEALRPKTAGGRKLTRPQTVSSLGKARHQTNNGCRASEARPQTPLEKLVVHGNQLMSGGSLVSSRSSSGMTVVAAHNHIYPF